MGIYNIEGRGYRQNNKLLKHLKIKEIFLTFPFFGIYPHTELLKANKVEKLERESNRKE